MIKNTIQDRIFQEDFEKQSKMIQKEKYLKNLIL